MLAMKGTKNIDEAQMSASHQPHGGAVGQGRGGPWGCQTPVWVLAPACLGTARRSIVVRAPQHSGC